MGNFHCIPESCARVVWREYLPPTLRYKYPDEDWIEIDADDYTLTEECPDKNYIIEFYYDYYSNDNLISANNFYRVSSSFKGKNFKVIGNPFDSFIKQICSAPGCPPPEYEVICDCDEECPLGTCAKICGSHICCYDPKTGISQKSIPISMYDSGLPNNLKDPGG